MTNAKFEKGLLDYEAKVAKSTARFPERPHLPERRLYTPLDTAGADYMEKSGFPGMYPFTRGVQPTMYRGRLWTMRAYAGFATAEETNARYKYLLQAGQTGLSVAMDLPTQIGLDSDAELSHGEVGKVGVAIDSLADMERLFEGIPLDKVSTSMTINGPAAVLLAMYVAVAEKQGVKPEVLRGTIQNDILKEYIARGTYIFPPRPSMRLITDTFEYCSKNIPKWNTISVGAYHIREAGASPVQEIAFAFANAMAYIDAAIKAGQKVDDFAPGISWIFTAGLDFFAEIAKFRAARRLWARIMKERYGATVPKAMMLRVHVHTAGSVLTAQQPLCNVPRITWQAMAAVLGGIQSMACCAYDEALSLPTEESATLALRTQQLLAYESGVADTIDPLAGSYYVESLTDQIEKEAMEYLEKIDRMGGAVAAIEQGYMQKEMALHAYEYQKAIETGKQTVIGVNKYVDNKPVEQNEVLKADLSVGERQIKRVNEMKAKRDNAAVKASLARLKEACKGTDNLMPYLIDAVKTYATLGEICGVMREVFGEYRQDGSTLFDNDPSGKRHIGPAPKREKQKES
ncbi:MAG: methylmalonyl-CoA mutase family protein [Succiniclasticum sp.]|jgi:methylmalonyl-CoA mutase N-terminal domain/subunit|nr:methylmalonyl-CoA mutase family protein [Succiniclasticum sp.]MEE3479832.1 methylmalonyl-CoA mutase family protein [Succiniclasticum sp.]